MVKHVLLNLFKADDFPDNTDMWRWQFGPNLHFKFDGTPDTDPLHFM